MNLGRPRTLTPAIAKRIRVAILGGNFQNVAVGLAGVRLRTFKKWIQRGRRESSGIYANLVATVKRAEADAERLMVQLVMQAAKKDAKHAQWWLERKLPDRWGRRDRLELSGNKKKPITEVCEVVVTTREEVAKVLARRPGE